MAVRTVKRSRMVVRASIGNSYLKRDYQVFTEAEKQEESPEKQLCFVLFRYMAKRTTDKFVLSGAHDVRSQADYLNTIIQLAFNIMLARNKAEAKTAREISSTGRVRYIRAWDTSDRGGRLGSERHCTLGLSLILGETAAELAARFDLTVELSVAQLHQLRARPDVLDQILAAFESAVPLNLDYRLILSVCLEDRTFRLVPQTKPAQSKKPAEPPSGADRLPLLGITTALGAD